MVRWVLDTLGENTTLRAGVFLGAARDPLFGWRTVYKHRPRNGDPRLTSSPTIGPLVPEIVKLVTERDRIKEDVVKQLEKALELAREGNIVAVAIAMVDKEGRGNYRWSEGDMATTMVGAVQRMQHMLNLAVDENVNWIEDTPDDPA